MKKWISIIGVVVYFNQHGPNCKHVLVCDDTSRPRCISPGTEDDLLVPIATVDDPLVIEAKLIVREQERVNGRPMNRQETKDFLATKPQVAVR